MKFSARWIVVRAHLHRAAREAEAKEERDGGGGRDFEKGRAGALGGDRLRSGCAFSCFLSFSSLAGQTWLLLVFFAFVSIRADDVYG